MHQHSEEEERKLGQQVNENKEIMNTIKNLSIVSKENENKAVEIYKQLWIIFLLFTFLIPITLLAQTENVFEENKGQWNDEVRYKVNFRNGLDLFIGENTFTYLFFNTDDIAHTKGHLHAEAHKEENEVLHMHALKMELLNVNKHLTVLAENPDHTGRNYFIGNDPSKWAQNVKRFKKVAHQNVYEGIDMNFYTFEENLKYDFIVQPQADASQIKWKYSGADELKIVDGKVLVKTSLGQLTEEVPYVYQNINGRKIQILAKYVLQDNVLSFDFPSGYNKNEILIIDPVLTASTNSGSTADNWGFTATYDEQGNIYSGGIAFSSGFPSTGGAFQTSFAGGAGGGDGNTNGYGQAYSFDIAISKFNPDGTKQIYATYLGGNKNEQPHSLVVNKKGELIVFGRTYSTDFPTSTNAYNKSNGGKADIILSKFDSTGASLLASTYVGGAADEAVNGSSLWALTDDLKYNYGDDARGEVIVDDLNNVYVASCTKSANFPTTPGAYMTSNPGGMQSACVFKMNEDFSKMEWSSYLGGNSNDATYSIALDNQNRAYVTGGTQSNNFPATPGVYTPTYQGGTDGFVAQFDVDGSKLLASTFIGTSSYDQSYFVQTDMDNDVYVFGQTRGLYPVSVHVYANPGSSQMVQKLSADLTQSLFSTTIGNGSDIPNISPTAFMVDRCERIYLSGWGRQIAQTNPKGTTVGMPVSSGAYQTSTDGGDFYLMVLKADAKGVEYATYFGGNQTSSSSVEHVDGGTSRFDKSGKIYQAVCGGCGGNNSFPTKPGAYSVTNKGSQGNKCNNAVFKFDFQLPIVNAKVFANTEGCFPYTVDFKNWSSGAKDYVWDFGDGSPIDTTAAPTHTYTVEGTYTAMFVAIDSASCNIADTTMITVTTGKKLSADFQPKNSCQGFTVNFTNVSSTNATTFHWDFGDPFSSSDTSSLMTPVYTYPASGNYTVMLIANPGDICADTIIAPITIDSLILASFVAKDHCENLSVDFMNTTSGATNIAWDFGDLSSTTDTSSAQAPSYTYPAAGTYTVTLISNPGNACADSATIPVQIDPANVAAFSQQSFCTGLNVNFNNTSVGASSYSWDFGDLSTADDTSSLQTTSYTYPDTGTYVVTLITNPGDLCADTLSVPFTVYLPIQASFMAPPGQCILPNGNTFDFNFTGNLDPGTNIRWDFGDPSTSADSSSADSTSYTYNGAGIYTVTLTVADKNCNSNVSQTVEVYALPDAGINADKNQGCLPLQVQFFDASTSAAGPLTYSWSFPDSTTATDQDPKHVFNIKKPGMFDVNLTVTDAHGCTDSEDYSLEGVDCTVEIKVPNVFTPGGDGVNDRFVPTLKGIRDLEGIIYNRWGSVIYTWSQVNEFWDGRTNTGLECNDGTYYYVIKAFGFDDQVYDLNGFVTLLRPTM